MADPYVYSGTDVLKNKFNLLDNNRLTQLERLYSTVRLTELHQSPIQGSFDLSHLQKIHKHIFQDIYEWAGKLRTVDIAKSTLFCPLKNLDSYQQKVFSDLKKENHLVGTDLDTFSQRAAYYLGEINMLHPFREGNGRTQREFMRDLALNAGFDLSFENVSPQQMLDASIQSANISNAGFEAIIKANLIPLPILDLNQRLNAIQNFKPDNTLRSTAQQQYLQRAKQQHEKSGWIEKSIDPIVVGELLKAGFQKENIVNTLVKHSPDFAGQEVALAQKAARSIVNDVAKQPEIQRAIRDLSQGIYR